MKVVALISGGKDSSYNMMQCVAEGHEILALANLKPENTDELNSYMYQTVGHDAINLYSQAMGLPLYRRTIQGQAVEKGMRYTCTTEDEVEDMFELLKHIKDQIDFEAVAVGAVLSNYQRVRVENVCSRLGLVCLAYLWRRQQTELLEEMINCNVDAIIIKVASIGLDPNKHLGKHLPEMFSHLCDINKRFDCHVCGEGGEYETLTLDCPLFKRKIAIDTSEIVIHSDDAFAPVGYLKFIEMHLENKSGENGFENLPFHRGDQTILNTIELNHIPRPEKTFGGMLDIFNQKLAGVQNQYTCNVIKKIYRNLAWISGISIGNSNHESIEYQTDLAMKKLESSLKDISSDLRYVVLVHVYVDNMENYAAINSKYGEYFKLNPPARVCVQTNFPDSTLFQMDCLALIPETLDSKANHDVMHVQSISHWAPANIGPYSQAVKVNEHTSVIAGCIGLWPSSMTVVEGGIDCEAPLALRHVARILEALAPGTTLSHVMSGACYVTDPDHVPVAKTVWRKMSNGEITEEKTTCNPLMCVVVPKLPRNAMVEWHVMSHKCSYQMKCDSLANELEKFTIHSSSCICPRHHTGSINTSLEIQTHFSNLSMDTSVPETMEYFIHNFASFMTSCDLTWASALVFRIFFRSDVFKNTHPSLKRVFKDTIEKYCGDEKCPALVFVPVSGLSTPTQVLAINGWLQNTTDTDENK